MLGFSQELAAVEGAAIVSTGLCAILPNMNGVKSGGALRIAFCLPASCNTVLTAGCTSIGIPLAAEVTSVRPTSGFPEVLAAAATAVARVCPRLLLVVVDVDPPPASQLLL